MAKPVTDTVKPTPVLARITLEDGSPIQSLILDSPKPVKLDASGSRDNVGVVSYTFKQNTSGNAGVDNYVDVDGCVNLTTPICITTPTNTTGFNIGAGANARTRTYYKVEVKDAAGNTALYAGNRYVDVKK